MCRQRRVRPEPLDRAADCYLRTIKRWGLSAMLARRVFAVGLGLFAFSEQASATAQLSAFDPTQGFAPTLVNFDAPSGKGFTWEKSLPCGANRATVTVRFKRAYQSGTIMPVAKVWLHSGKSGDPSEQWIGGVLKAPTDTYKLDAMEWLEKVVGSQ